MCMFSPAPDPVYSSITVYDATTGALVQQFEGSHIIVISGKNQFTIYKVLKMNPTETDESPVFSTNDIPQKLCAECQHGVFDEIKEPSDDEIAGSHIFPPPPDTDSESILVNLARKSHQEHCGVSLQESQSYFCVYKNNELLACYTKSGFTYKPKP